ncbi:MAG: hypothetical protein IK120_07875, partial [Muribaculaceae bacterium]|nr:hypothetical protein [Muribaculaceae bacterium]
MADFPGNQNTYQAYIRPCMLYGLFGWTWDPNYFHFHYGISAHSFTNVMVPQGRIETVEAYGNNLIYYGDILSDNDPAGDVETKDGYKYSPKFMRRPVWKIPGFAGKFNFLKMDFDSTGGYVALCNPYPIVEMQSDLRKITDLLNLFYPFNFNQNQLSNFVFVPFVWANNLFQSWSNDPKYDAADTTDAMTNATSGRLSAPSKMTEGRKKALILVVNKPDWFEPGELTYLGFDNDFSEIPMIESDCIRGDIDYSDTSKYFADGTAYDGTIQGQKKILVYTTQSGTTTYTNGNYTCTSATGRLSFPQKYLLKIVVEPSASSASIGFSNITSDSSATTTGTQPITGRKEFYIVPSQMNGNYVDFAMTNIKLISAEITNRPYEMKNGVAEFKELRLPDRGIYIDLLKQALDGKLQYNVSGSETTAPNNHMYYGSDTTGDIENAGIKFGDSSSSSPSTPSHDTWQNTNPLPPNDASEDWYSVCYGNGKFVAVAGWSDVAAYSSDGITWPQATTTMPSSEYWSSVCYGNGKFVAVAGWSDVAAYSSDGITWTEA